MKTSYSKPFFVLILATIGSWFLFHLLALLGFFLGIAYPIWWFLAPEKTVCFSCRTKRKGEWCPLCKKHIKESDAFSPNSLRSAILNGVLIICLTVISIGIVFVEKNILIAAGFPPTEKSVSFIIPAKKQYKIGEIFPMKIQISGIKTSINAVQADLGFDPAKIEILNISTKGSFASVFLQKDINNKTGYARITGGIPNPGFSEEEGMFATIMCRAKSSGLTTIDYLPTSLVLANDSKGTNVIKELASVAYLILPDKITSNEEKQQQTILMNAENILGANTNKMQMTFYEDTKVLGAETTDILQEKTPEKTSVQKYSLLSILARIDVFVFDIYRNIVKSIFAPSR